MLQSNLGAEITSNIAGTLNPKPMQEALKDSPDP